ncbi:MAG: hypothetical protein ACR2OE_13445, partial [Thermomicrobiales bacterium]
DATNDYVPTNGDQYGPFRIGPAYPLTLLRSPRIEVAAQAMFGDMILTTHYSPDYANTKSTTAAPIRTQAEITSLIRMLTAWREGTCLLDEAIALAPVYRKPTAKRMANLGRFIEHSIQTTINVKKWWLLKSRALIEQDPVTAGLLLDQLIEIGKEEYANAEATIPIVEADSRLGWEPTMDYLGDADHIRWKLAHLRYALDHEIPAYRAALRQ